MSLGYFVDIQGTLLSDKDKSPLPGALELLEYFNTSNTPYTLVTNNTKQISSELIDELHVKGFCFPKERFIDPLMVLSDLVGEKRVLPFGSEKFCDVLSRLGFNVVSKNPDVILVASDDRFGALDFAKMIDAVLNGAKPIGMHATSTYVKRGFRYPGVGAVMVMVEYATGKKADIVGKPSRTFYEKAYKILQKQNANLSLHEVSMISDDGIGDLVGAKDMGIGTRLVLSGKCKNLHEVDSIKDKIDRVYSGVDEILREIS